MEVKQKKSRLKNVIVFILIAAVSATVGHYIVQKRTTLPNQEEIIKNLESFEYEINIEDEVNEKYLELVLNSIINQCYEHSVSIDIHAAFKYYFEYAYDDYDHIDKILIAQIGRVHATESINNWETVTDYFKTGIVMFYFDSEESAKSFYSNAVHTFDAISVYYDRAIHNLFDEKVVHAQKGNVVYISSDITFETACGYLGDPLFSILNHLY